MGRLTTRRFSSAAAAGTSPGAQPPHPPPPPRLPTPPPLAPRTPRTRRRSTPQSAPPQLPGFRKAPGAGRQQPLAAQRLGIRVPPRAPAELRLPGRLRGAMISYTAVPASGAPRAPAVAAGGPDPHPAPPPQSRPRHQHPAPLVPPHPEPSRVTPYAGAHRSQPRCAQASRQCAAASTTQPSGLASLGCSPAAPRPPRNTSDRNTRQRTRVPNSSNHLHLHFLCNALQVSQLEPFGMGAQDHRRLKRGPTAARLPPRGRRRRAVILLCKGGFSYIH